MAWYDLDPEELTGYRPHVEEPTDFDHFWATTLAEAEATAPLPDALTVGPTMTVGRFVIAHDITIPGFAGDPVRGWFLRPRDAVEPLPCVVELSAYGCGRGLPIERLVWPNMGYAYLFMDARGQGSGWGSGGSTGDPHGTRGPSAPGFLTRGIDSPYEHYYRRLFTDAARAVQAARSMPEVDEDRVAVTGTSQGGACAISAAALVPEVWALMADVPFLCHVRRAATLVDTAPYSELATYLRVHRDSVEEVFTVLSYVDVVNFAKRVRCPAQLSVALMDTLCPPSTVYAAANHMPTPPRMDVYPFNDHEGGENIQLQRQIDWLAAR